LSEEQIAEIVDIQLDRVREFLTDKRIELEVTAKAKSVLASDGYDPVFGARPLKRTIQRKVLDALATRLLEGHVREGDRVRCDVDAGHPEELSFTPQHDRRGA